MRSAAIVLLLYPLVGAARAEDAPDPKPVSTQLATMQAEIDELRVQQAALKARLAASEASAAEAAAQSNAGLERTISYTPAPGRGLTFSLGTPFSLSIRARTQIRDTVSIAPDHATTNEINVKTVRLWIQGHVLTPDLQFALHLGFVDPEHDSASPILDAYVDYLRLRDLHIRVGQFFVPLDRGRTTLEFAQQFPDRAQVLTELGLDRDVGIAFSSTDLFGSHGILGYSLGVFGGEGKNHFGGAGVGFLYVARVTITPFGPFDDNLEGDYRRLRRPRLAFGVGGAYNQSTNRQRSTSGPTLSLGTFDYGHASADMVLKVAGFSLLAEVLYRQSRQGSLTGIVNGAPAREWSRSAVGYLVQLGIMLHDRVELVARYDDLRPIGQTDPALIALVATSGKELGGGLNVFVNGHAFKLQSAYHYLFGDSISQGRHVVQVQLEASF